MESNRKNSIDNAFLETLIKVCTKNNVPLCQTTILASFFEKDKFKLQLCRKDKQGKELSISEIFNAKMVGLGMSKESLEKLLRCIHFAFIKEKGVENERISLLIYFSTVVRCVCIGILEDKIPLKTLMIVDIFDAMGLGNEQLN